MENHWKIMESHGNQIEYDRTSLKTRMRCSRGSVVCLWELLQLGVLLHDAAVQLRATQVRLILEAVGRRFGVHQQVEPHSLGSERRPVSTCSASKKTFHELIHPLFSTLNELLI